MKELPDQMLGKGAYLELRRRRNWEFVERRGVTEVVAIIAVTSDEKGVLVEQYREPLCARTIEWPAGLVGDDSADEEHMLEAANRELEEETGFRAGKLSVVTHGPSSGGLTSEVVSFIRAAELNRVGAGGGVGGEKITVHKVLLSEIDDWLEGRVGDGLLIDPKVYAGLYFLSRESQANNDPILS